MKFIKSIWLRRIHKWVGLVIGLQFLAWAISGTAMALLDMDEVAGGPMTEVRAAALPADTTSWPSVQQALSGQPVTRLSIRSLPQGSVYEVTTANGVRLFSATDGTPVAIDRATATAIASAAHPGGAAVKSVSPLPELTFAVRDHQLPIWQIDFRDSRNSSYYVSGSTGELLARRNDTWRWWDFFWMLHIMDYSERASFNHPLGVVSIYFIIIQPVLLGTWCTLCLIAALAMLLMMPFALDEVVAMGQYLYWSKRRGRPLIRTFFKGGPVEGGQEDDSDDLANLAAFWTDTIRGITLPWTLMVATAVGVLLMLERLILPIPWDLANTHHVIGALVITVSIIATAEVARALRFVNLGLAVWLAASPWLAPESSTAAIVVSLTAAALIAGLSLPRGRRSREHYAGWDRFVV